jgi:hypothetical protein
MPFLAMPCHQVDLELEFSPKHYYLHRKRLELKRKVLLEEAEEQRQAAAEEERRSHILEQQEIADSDADLELQGQGATSVAAAAMAVRAAQKITRSAVIKPTPAPVSTQQPNRVDASVTPSYPAAGEYSP